MNVNVTIILPFFNAERFLERCLKSIEAQNYKSFECILINDGSTDNSKLLVEKFVKKDARFKLINKSNTGVSDSRNYGIRVANGKYIYFIDSDDWIEPNSIEDMVKCIEIKKCDLVMSDIWFDYTNRKLIPYTREMGIVKKEDALVSLYNDTWTRPVVWGKLYKKDIIIDNKIQFKSEIAYAEDILFLTKVLLCSEKIEYINKPLYHYFLDNSNSALHTIGRKKQFQSEWLTRWDAYEEMENVLQISFSSGNKVMKEFRASKVELARGMIHLEYEYNLSNTSYLKEQYCYVKKYALLYIYTRKVSFTKKILTLFCAISPRMEYRLIKVIKR